MRSLILQGVKQNNLKGITLDVPLGKSVIVTGPSGSGKSSLAFETIYAEGQRRYMQSLSTYARQFLEKFPAPNVERIQNIPPTIALEQSNPVRNSRATVGTSTEIYDYLRLLYEKIGVEYCGKCHLPMELTTQEDIYQKILSAFAGKTVLLAFARALPRKKADVVEGLNGLLRSGYTRGVFQGELFRIEDWIAEKKGSGKKIQVIADRIRMPEAGKGVRSRLVEAVKACWDSGEGRADLFCETEERYFDLKQSFFEGIRCPKCGTQSHPKTAIAFSFNSPLGACSNCNGFGNTLEVDENLVVSDDRKSLAQGAIDPFTKPSLARWQGRLMEFCRAERVDLDLPYRELDAKSKKKIFDGKGKFKGVRGLFNMLQKEKYKMRIRVFISRYVSPQVCSECKGGRLNESVLRVRIAEKNVSELGEMTLDELLLFFKALPLTKKQAQTVKDVLRQITRRLDYLNTVGLGYLTLSRLARSLSGGEYQRILLATQLSQGLTDTLYVLDEPSIGLHPKDTSQLMKVLSKLLKLGNSLVVVEHDPEVIEWGQHVVDLGPGSGQLGGEVLFSGSQKSFARSASATAKAVTSWRSQCRKRLLRPKYPEADQWLVLHGASGNNLKKLDLRFPLNQMVVITGVSGSGKSTLIVDTLYPALTKRFLGRSSGAQPFEFIEGAESLQAVELIDQSPIGRSTRSNPMTFMKAYDEVRRLLAGTSEAARRGLTPGHFSFNVAGGRCDQCDGEGRIGVDMVFMEDVYVPCDQCHTKRFKPKVLGVRYQGKNIHDILQMTVDEAHSFFRGNSALRTKLTLMREVGLGYLQLGQSSDTLSGGEAQRIKIARELSQSSIKRGNTLFILDEPTTGLHFDEVEKLLTVFHRLVRSGHTVVVIEHNVQVICAADYVVDLGPEGGEGGGSVVAMGTPKALAKKKLPHTGKYLAEIMSEKKL